MPWGFHLLLNLKSCNHKVLSANEITEYVIELCTRIDMKRYGECQCIYFGEDPKVSGLSMTQLIETSLISGHFVDLNHDAYLDIFSCKQYDINEVIRFTRETFEPSSMTHVYLER